MINVIYNYFNPLNAKRQFEIDYCFNKLIANPNVDLINCFYEDEIKISSPKIKLHKVENRVTFRSLYSIAMMKGEVNVVINSDCYLDNDTTLLLNNIKEKHFWAISRWNIKSLNPFDAVFAGKKNSQDCWVVRSDVPPGIELGFCMGYPGCDNRIAWEFNDSGYVVSNPSKSINLFHLHLDSHRKYKGKVPPPYLHIEPCYVEDIK